MQQIESFINHELNAPQREAVLQPSGGLLVVAGAGSGKTRVITARIAHLLTKGLGTPSSIVALTFTNKAALEMKERIKKFVGDEWALPFVGTFHAYCLLLLRRNGYLTGFDQFTILDADDQEQMIKRLIKGAGLEKRLNASQLMSYVSQQKNGGLFDQEVFSPPFFVELARAYEAEKQASKALDFDDLMLYVLRGFEKFPQFAEDFRSRVAHILVDEYQDTNRVQHNLLKQMALKPDGSLAIESICAVGDEDQSIYSWRGAQVTNMQDFKTDFAPVTLVKIEQNYRSVQPILQAANKVISHNRMRTPKNLWSERAATNRVVTVSCQSGYQEADAVASYVIGLPENIKRSSVALLYRTHFQSRSLEEALMQRGIPYHIVGGIRFYERKEIKDLLAYLRVVVNPFDRVSLLRIINTPTRGLGAKFESDLMELWQQEPLLNFKQVLNKMLTGPDALTGIRAESVRQFIAIFDDLTPEHEPSYVLNEILTATDYRAFLRTSLDSDEADSKIDNIRELMHSITYAEKKQMYSGGDPLTTALFLQEIALLQEKIAEDENREDCVHLMTLHAVKGLEFDTVIIVGLEDGLLPSSRSLSSHTALEEERRLLYVGMTRAKDRLILTHAQQRTTYGQLVSPEISRFIKELPADLVQHIDLCGASQSQLGSLLHAWRGGKAFTQAPLTTFGRPSRSAKATPDRAFNELKKTTSVPKTFSRPLTTKPAAPSVQKTGGAIFDTNAPWKKNQVVTHPTFGPGLIKMVEKKGEDEWYLTIAFKMGEKKILSTFVKAS